MPRRRRRSSSPLRALAGQALPLLQIFSAAFPPDPVFAARRGVAPAPFPPGYPGKISADGEEALAFDAGRGGGIHMLLGRPRGPLLPNANAAVAAANLAAALLQAADASAATRTKEPLLAGGDGEVQERLEDGGLLAGGHRLAQLIDKRAAAAFAAADKHGAVEHGR